MLIFQPLALHLFKLFIHYKKETTCLVIELGEFFMYIGYSLLTDMCFVNIVSWSVG